MATRSVYKLLTKSYVCSSLSCRPPSAESSSKTRSRPVISRAHSASVESRTKPLHQIRNISKSVYDFKDDRYFEEEEDYVALEENPYYHRSRYTSSAFREVEEKEEEPDRQFLDDDVSSYSVVYEMDDNSKPKQPYFDVINYMKNAEKHRAQKAFPHLQPRKLVPFGSRGYALAPSPRTARSIVYPVTKETGKHTTVSDEMQHRSSFKSPEYSGFEDTQEWRASGRSGRSVGSTDGYDMSSQSEVDSYHSNRTKMQTGGRTSTRKGRTEEMVTRNSRTAKQTQKYGISNKEDRNFNSWLNKKSFQSEPNSRYYSTQHSERETSNHSTPKSDNLEAFKLLPKRKITFGKIPESGSPNLSYLGGPPLKEGKPLTPLGKCFESRKPLSMSGAASLFSRNDQNYEGKIKILPKTLNVKKHLSPQVGSTTKEASRSKSPELSEENVKAEILTISNEICQA